MRCEKKGKPFFLLLLARLNTPNLTAADPDPNAGTSGPVRRHDLDALRAAAMLLGLAYHAALSFSLGAGWLVQDVQQSKVLYVFQAFVHGFRMQLFMVLSGFFTALLWRQKGLKNLLWNRFRKIFLPCLAGLITVVPAIRGAGLLATRLRNAPSRDTSREFNAAPVPGNRELVLAAVDPQAGNAPEVDAENISATPNSNTQTAAPLGHGSVFPLIWYLWFLIWLTVLFGVYAIVARQQAWKIPPHPLILSQRSLLWLVPLTAVPGWFMGSGRSEFGPDTSMGFVPMPHVFTYYAVFFGFGVLYAESEDATGRLGVSWRWSLPVGVLVVLPLALEFTAGIFGGRDTLLPAGFHRPVAVLLQSLYAWMMAFAGIGMFRSLFGGSSGTIRYLSDASYWFYLAHLPVVILLQAAVCEWSQPALLKFLVVCLFAGMAMLVSYQTLVRYTVVGSFLMGNYLKLGAKPHSGTRVSL